MLLGQLCEPLPRKPSRNLLRGCDPVDRATADFERSETTTVRPHLDLDISVNNRDPVADLESRLVDSHTDKYGATSWRPAWGQQCA